MLYCNAIELQFIQEEDWSQECYQKLPCLRLLMQWHPIPPHVGPIGPVTDQSARRRSEILTQLQRSAQLSGKHFRRRRKCPLGLIKCVKTEDSWPHSAVFCCPVKHPHPPTPLCVQWEPRESTKLQEKKGERKINISSQEKKKKKIT